MTGKEFMRAVTNGEADLLQRLLSMLADTDTDYCVIGGLAVNAYAEPVVSLDLDVVVATAGLETVREMAASGGFQVEEFQHSINLNAPGSDLRIQLQLDPRYQEFMARGRLLDVLGYRMKVASIDDVLTGKTWAYLDETRRRSKRQKDLADILRLIEAHPELEPRLHPSVRSAIGRI